MPAHPPDNDCLYWQSLSGVVVKVRQGTPYRRLATNGGEKCGLVGLEIVLDGFRVISDKRLLLAMDSINAIVPVANHAA